MSAFVHNVECFMAEHKWFCRILTTVASSVVASFLVSYIAIKALT
jgi:hypothetical protein